jgi:hypothetical protein
VKVDPNTAIGMQSVHVMCRNGVVELPDGTHVPLADLPAEGGAFAQFCKTLDPNTCYIGAYLPYRADEDLFYRAREVAFSANKLHMQATVEKADIQIQYWNQYKVGYHV